jgi:hypothetical protein
MKKLICLLVLCLLLGTVTMALAEPEIPNLVGVWKVQGEGAIWKRANNDAAGDKDKMIFKKLEAQNVIEKQEGRSFYGYYKSPDKKEKLVGVIGHDNESVHFSGRYGFGKGKLIAPDKMEVIYLQTTSKGSQAWLEILVRK